MDVLIVEPLEPEVMQWLAERHAVRYAPELARDARALRQALFNVRALVIPPSVALDAQALHYAPMLRAVGRLSSGSENIDLDACGRAGVEVVRSVTASAVAEAEFMVGGLLQMLRRVPVLSPEGLLVGRELGGATIGLVGMVPAARSLAQLLSAFGSRVIGYDPAVHASDNVWTRWRVEPVALRELMEQSDGVCVQLTYFSRYQGLIGERAFPAALQAEPGADQRRSFEPVRSGRAGGRARHRPHGRGLVRQPRARCARPGQTTGRHRHLADHAARGGHHARVARARRLGGGAAHRRIAVGREFTSARRVQIDGARRTA